jgi:hypothetical protein
MVELAKICFNGYRMPKNIVQAFCLVCRSNTSVSKEVVAYFEEKLRHETDAWEW